MPSLTPSVAYDDAAGAVEWLTRVLGFEADGLFHGADGNVAFALLRWHGRPLFVSSRPPEDNAWSTTGPVAIALGLDDDAAVDAVHRGAVSSGAEVVRAPHVSRSPLFPDGSYQFDVRDPEGNLWTVGTYRP